MCFTTVMVKSLPRFLIVAVLALCTQFGCESSTPVSQEQVKEMSATPWGLFSGTGKSSGQQVQFDAGGEMTLTDQSGTRTGTYVLDEAAKTIKVNINGQEQLWQFTRENLDLTITFPDGRTGTYSMQ